MLSSSLTHIALAQIIGEKSTGKEFNRKTKL
jgi:hypothetical protein